MNGIGRLGEMYGLSPATMAGLAQIKGDPPPQQTIDVPTQVIDDAPEPRVRSDPMERGASAYSNSVATEDPGQPGLGSAVADAAKRMVGGSASVVKPGWLESPMPPEPTQQQDGEPTRDQVAAGLAIPSSPSVTIPAHWQPSSKAYSVQYGMNPELLAPGQQERDTSRIHAMSAADEKLQAAQLAGQADAAYYTSNAMAMNAAREQMAAIEARKAQFKANEQQKLSALRADTQRTIDPDGLWKERGTGAQVLSAIMIGLGQFATMASGRGSNAALQIVNEAIDRNIAAQRANLDNAHRRLDEASSLYARNLAEFGDEQQAVLATKMQYMDAVQSMANAQKAKAGELGAAAGRDEFLAALHEQNAKDADLFGERIDTKMAEQGTSKFMPAQTLGGPGAATKREGNLVTAADGTTYHFGEEKTAEEARKRLQAFGDVQFYTNKILNLRKETMKLDPILDHVKYQSNMLNLQRLDDKLAVAESLSGGQGTVTAADTERRKSVGLVATAGLGKYKGAGRLLSADYDAANNAYTDAAKESTDLQRQYLRTAGGEIYQREYARDAQGNLIPTGRYTGQDAKPPQRLAPHGSKGMNPNERINDDDAPDYETTPAAPIRSGVYVPSAGSGKRGGKDAKAPHIGKRK